MAQNIENMAEKTSKLSIDPIYDKNWCDMPADIKLECIGKMELRERLSLRCTAKTEKSLVDSQKMNFVEGEFVADYDYEISLKSKNWILFINSFLDKTDACDFMKYIFKIGIFENLKFDSSYFLAKQCANAGLQISAKNIDFVRTHFEDMLFILEKINIGVESIKIEADGDEVVEKGFPLEKVLESPKIWINKNSNIGSTFQTLLTDDGASQHFSNQFKNRILSVSDERIRIQTNNPATHILLERGLLGIGVLDSCYQFFRLSVISADMKESDYEKNHKEWIREICPPELEDLMEILAGGDWQ